MSLTGFNVSEHVATQMIMRLRWIRFAPVAILIALPFVVYANGYRHAYHLDDAYTIVSNPSVRSLHAIPSYFADPGTYTTLREQADYRPVLQATFALNYWMGGYDVRWWHFTQIVLHVIVTLGLYALCQRILSLMPPWSPSPHPELITFAAAAIFAVHPASSGVVNYLNARSSLLTAAFLLPALLLYMRSADTTDYERPQWKAALLYTLALFTKVEAIGALGALWAFDLWQRGRERPWAGLRDGVRASFDRRTLTRLAPVLAITLVYFVIRWRVMAPFPFADARHASDVGASEYLATQLTAWWYYLARWIAPVRLVADYLAYPVFRSWLDPVVLLAAAGWCAVGALLVGSWKRAPHLLFLAVAALALLIPTSSVAPLAEMVNEHRPYLPVAILSLAMVTQVGWRVHGKRRDAPQLALLAAGALAFVSLSVLTWRRNTVFLTEAGYWHDVLAKAPSSRAHLNYGVALMKRNEMPAALREFHRSLELAPHWYFTHINLGIAYRHLGRPDSAQAHFDQAVLLDRYSGQALTWRGEFRLSQRDYGGARDDFARSLLLGVQRYRNVRGLANAFAGLGDGGRCAEQSAALLAIDPSSTAADATAISCPARQSVELAAADAVGHLALMAQALELLYQRNDPTKAAHLFQRILRGNPLHYGATYQLATALDRAGKRSEARPLWKRVLDMATASADARTAATARARLARDHIGH